MKFEKGAMASACTVAALAEAPQRINYQAPKQTTPVYTPRHPGQPGSPPKRIAVWWGGVTRDPAPRGGKVRLPQRP